MRPAQVEIERLGITRCEAGRKDVAVVVVAAKAGFPLVHRIH